MDVFGRYSPFIQNYIYRSGWENLRAVQVAAGDVIFNSDNNLLLSASTASGKTEAAFFPIISLFNEDPPKSVGCLYIAPLKALINDQFLRLDELCEEGDIPVWHWHGDVSATHKKKLLKSPSGILQITPESLEAMMIRRHAEIPHLFCDLRFIVIDEIHALLRGDRGLQTMCLIERLCKCAAVNPRRIGLSATVGDPSAVSRFLSAGSGRKTVCPKFEGIKTKWRLSMEHFFTADPQAGSKSGINGLDIIVPPEKEIDIEDEKGKNANELLISGTIGSEKVFDPGYKYIFLHSEGRKCLVFSNSREECEAVTSTLRSYCEYTGEPERFLIHHGNLSASLRESAEADMKDDTLPLTTCTTATLELGIDIGKLERAFQLDSPFTVSSFLQRMGRTGRRGEPEEMHFVMREDHPEPRALMPETIPWPLIQGIALFQTYIEDHWVEPPRENRLPFSLLYHQTMSTLMSCGEMSPAELASRVLTLHPFENINSDDFKLLLYHLIKTNQIQKTENGGLIVGLAGERVTSNFKFYAVFQENEEFSVRCEGVELGTIVKPPPPGDKIAIAGRVWVVEEVDYKGHRIFVSLVKGKVPAYFGDVAGDIHTRILKRMKTVLSESMIYPYLLTNARARLSSARESAQVAGLIKNPLIPLGGNMYALFPWLGTYSFLTLERYLRLILRDSLGLKGFTSVRPYYMQFSMKVGPEEFFEILYNGLQNEIDPMTLLFPKENPVFEKYDEFLPEELVKKGFAYGVLDIKEMKKEVLDLIDSVNSDL